MTKTQNSLFFCLDFFFHSNEKAMVEKHADLPCLAFICSMIPLVAENLTLFSHLELLILDCFSEVFTMISFKSSPTFFSFYALMLFLVSTRYSTCNEQQANSVHSVHDVFF